MKSTAFSIRSVLSSYETTQPMCDQYTFRFSLRMSAVTPPHPSSQHALQNRRQPRFQS
jgi:hypothetical protein